MKRHNFDKHIDMVPERAMIQFGGAKGKMRDPRKTKNKDYARKQTAKYNDHATRKSKAYDRNANKVDIHNLNDEDYFYQS